MSEAELRPLRRLIEELDSDDFRTREQASARFRPSIPGEWVPLVLHEVAENPSLEVVGRLQHLLTNNANFAFSPAMLRRLRAVYLLEEIGSAEAKSLLAALAKGSEYAPLTSEARRALDRMRK